MGVQGISKDISNTRYSPRQLKKNGKSEGVFEIKCCVLDCVTNDRTAYDDGFGFCKHDDIEINKKGICASYIADFIFIAYLGKYSDYVKTDEATKRVDRFWGKNENK